MNNASLELYEQNVLECLVDLGIIDESFDRVTLRPIRETYGNENYVFQYHCELALTLAEEIDPDSFQYDLEKDTEWNFENLIRFLEETFGLHLEVSLSNVESFENWLEILYILGTEIESLRMHSSQGVVASKKNEFSARAMDALEFSMKELNELVTECDFNIHFPCSGTQEFIDCLCFLEQHIKQNVCKHQKYDKLEINPIQSSSLLHSLDENELEEVKQITDAFSSMYRTRRLLIIRKFLTTANAFRESFKRSSDVEAKIDALIRAAERHFPEFIDYHLYDLMSVSEDNLVQKIENITSAARTSSFDKSNPGGEMTSAGDDSLPYIKKLLIGPVPDRGGRVQDVISDKSKKKKKK